MKWMMFSKNLQALPLERAGAVVRELGFEGIDLTVRPGGHVEPARVRDELPRASALLRDAGLAVPLLTTAITSADDASAADTFETAARAGTREIKLGYWRYGAFGSIASTLDAVRRDLDGIERLAQRTGVRVNLHTHSEDHVTSQPPLVWHLIKDRDPAAVGAYVDTGHLCVEGGGDGWRIALDLLRDRITLVAVKDLDWQSAPDARLGKPRWYTRVVPPQLGVVPWPSVFACLRAIGFDGWLSVHSEYQGAHSWRDLTTDQLIEQTRADLAYWHQVSARPDATTDAISRRAPSKQIF